ncbi:MAG TPA: phage tail tape measure protein [Anaerolineae bacterium]|nr:phage tail tape measure protein [Anaerolineae bacterium]
MTNEFKIKITIDGQDAKVEAGKLRQVIEQSLGHIEIAGKVDIVGLEAAGKQMAALRQDAGSLGRAIAQGMSQQWDALEQRLAGIQSHITGIVRVGEKTNIAGEMLESMPELEAALSANDKKALDLTLKMQDLTARTGELTRSIAELGRVQVQPLSGGQVRTLSELFKGLSETYTQGKITKAVQAIDKELAPLAQQIDAQLVAVSATLEQRRADLNAEIAKTAQAITELEQIKPPMPTVFGVELTEEQQAWQAQYEALITQYEAQNQELDAVRSEIIQGDAQQLRDQLLWRRRELEKPLEEEHLFWREWSMDSVKEIADALRATGQGSAAQALEQMEAAFEERKRLQTQIKRAFGGLQQGGQAELPEGAQGTLVDFITGERTLGEVANTATGHLEAQTKALSKKVKAFDAARLAGEGFTETERKAVEQLEKAAQRELRGATKAGTPMEETAAAEREILGRLALEVRSVTAAMDQALDAAAEEARASAAAMEQALDAPVAEEAEAEAKGLLKVWQWVADKLVGHSVIPDMVTAINEWLALVGQDAAQQNQAQIAAAEQKARALIRLAETEARAGIEAEKRLTAETVAQTKYRQTQRQEAAKRVTVRQRATSALDVDEGKAALREQERQNKLLAQARILTAELGLQWADVAAGMVQSGDSIETTLGGLKRLKQEQAAVNREVQQRARLEQEAQRLSAALGISWDQVDGAMQATGLDLQTVLRELRQVESEQRRVAQEAREIREQYSGVAGGVRLFTAELEKARQSRQGLFQVTGDLQQIGNSMRMNAGIVTGAVAVAGRDYLTFAKQSDVAARSLALNADLTQELRQATIEQSATLAVLDPETTARGITVWAQATGQAVDSQQELNALLQQTIPIQQAAALSQTDIATLSDATAGAINQYGLTLADTTRVVAIFNKISDDTLASVGDVAEGFKYVGPSADRAGESIEATAVAFSILGDNGIRGTQAGTSYGKMLDNLLIPKSTEAEETLTRLFGSADAFYDAEGAFIGTARAVDMLAAALAGTTDQEREVALSALFDTNSLRAATLLIREQTEARQEGVNILSQSAATLGKDALEVWETQLSDWEESDVYRVQQAEMRWKAFWLTIGQQGLDMALPFLEKAAQMITDLTAAVQANPWLTAIVSGVATGGIVIGTVITAVGTVSKTVLSLQTLTAAYKSTILKQQTAEARFQGTVVSSAEQFRSIITQAATQAATTEQAGAEAESAIEAQGAVQENAIEQAGATQIAGTLARIAGALAVGELGSRALTGQSMLGWGSTREGEQAAQTRLSELQGAGPDQLRNELRQLRDDIALLDQYVVQEGERGALLFNGEYWKDLIFGAGGEETARVRELMGGGLQATSGAALQDKLAELQAVEYGLSGMLAVASDDWNDVGVGVARAAREAQGATGAMTDELYTYTQAAQAALQLTPEQTRVVEAYIDLLQRQEEAVADFNDQVAEATRDLNTDLAKLEQDYQQQRRKTATDFQASQLAQQQDFQRRQAQAAADHQKQMRRMQEDHESRVADLEIARDAAGLYEEQQNYAKERARAEEDFAGQQGQEAANFALEQTERQRQHVEQMAQMQVQYAEQKQARLVEYQEQVAELQTQHQEELARLDQEYFDKLNAELKYYAFSEDQQAAYYAAMLQDADVWLKSKRQLWEDYVKNLPVPRTGNTRDNTSPYAQPGSSSGRTTRMGGRAAGGYADYGRYTLGEAGREFVLSAHTTRQLEGALGNLSQARVLQAMGGAAGPTLLSIQASFTGMGPNDRAWFEARLGQFARELQEVVAGRQ